MTQIISKSLLASHIKTLSALTTHANAKAVKSLQRGLTGERELSGDKYMDNAELLGAYSAYYFPISYMQMSYALSALPLPVHKDSSFRLLDFGSGQGAATSALLDKIFTACPNASVSINLIDHSKKALELASSFLKKEYPSVRALDNVSLSIGDREMVSIRGESGCGKSTLLHVIAGLVPADSGTITKAFSPRGRLNTVRYI